MIPALAEAVKNIRSAAEHNGREKIKGNFTQSP